MRNEFDFLISLESQRGQERLATLLTSAKQLLRFTLHLCFVAIVLMGLACRNGSTVSVQLMPNSAQTLEPGKALPISATLSNDPARQGVTWTLTGAGALVAKTTTSVMYQAPSSIGEGASVMVTATSVADGRKAASLTIILVPPKRTTSAHKNPRKQTEEGARG